MLKLFAHRRHPFAGILAMSCLLAFALVGCGDDDDDSLTAPGPTGFDDFDQATAITQSSVAGSQAVSLVQSITAMTVGYSKMADKDYEYGWNPETERWEWRYEYEGEGYLYDYLYTVQYLDADGEPQQDVTGASSIVHTMDGDSSYHYEYEGVVGDQEWSYDYDTQVTGLGTETHTMTGSGGYDWDYEGSSAGQTYSYSYDIDWVILGDGLTQPAAGGCPTGTFRYDFEPFYSLVVFDGSNVAVSTLYDADGDPVPGGEETHQLYCDGGPGF